jgi:hypothetical protein
MRRAALGILSIAGGLSAALGAPRGARAEDAVTPGELVVERPTLHNLGFEWPLAGDDDRDASVTVEYRKRGEARWRAALPLLRIGDEKVWRAKEFMEYVTPRLFAGSILDLEEGTAYECRLTMRDPDGVKGAATREVTVSTRREPRAAAGGRVRHVYPRGHQGPRQEPSYTGLKDAYYGPGLGDWDVVAMRPVAPGDTILVHAGLYKADPLDYVDELGLPFHGAYVLTIDGTADKPITIKAAGDGEVIFDGAGAYRLFDVMAADHHHFEGLTIRNTDIAFYAGLKGVLGSSGLVVRRCRLEDVGMGVLGQFAGSRDFYIADNVMIGRDDAHRLVGWRHSGIFPPATLRSYTAVKVYGQGHVIAHNYVAYFHDGITVCTHGPPAPGEKATAIDIYNNDVFTVVDDFIEADGGAHNIRVLRNRGFNAAEHGLSAQPVFGGPAYFVRNIVYNVPTGGGMKYGGANPAGVVVYHNTFVTELADALGSSNVHYRNNLILGTGDPQKAVLRHTTFTAYSSFDHNGYRPNKGPHAAFRWRAPAAGTLRDYAIAPGDAVPFATLAAFAQATGQERHGVLVDYDVFRNVRPPDPARPHAVYAIGDTDFRLRPGSAAADRGVPLPNVNDGFTGRAPDLGALEIGHAVPIYGPRPAPAPRGPGVASGAVRRK